MSFEVFNSNKMRMKLKMVFIIESETVNVVQFK